MSDIITMIAPIIIWLSDPMTLPAIINSIHYFKMKRGI